MTFEQFKSKVDEFLGNDANRQNVSTLKANYIKAALRDLTEHIPALRIEKTDRYSIAGTSGFKGVTQQGNASVGDISTNSEITQIWYVQRPEGQDVSIDPGDGDPLRIPVYLSDWENRQDLVLAKPMVIGKKALIAIGPSGTFYLYPKLKANQFLEIKHRPIDIDFSNGDQVLFGEQEAEVVSYFVLAKLRRQIDQKEGMRIHDSYMTDYMLGKRQLYIRYKDQAEITHSPSSNMLIKEETPLEINNA